MKKADPNCGQCGGRGMNENPMGGMETCHCFKEVLSSYKLEEWIELPKIPHRDNPALDDAQRRGPNNYGEPVKLSSFDELMKDSDKIVDAWTRGYKQAIDESNWPMHCRSIKDLWGYGVPKPKRKRHILKRKKRDRYYSNLASREILRAVVNNGIYGGL